MLVRFCNLCYKDISASIVNLRKYGKRVAAARFKKRDIKNKQPSSNKTEKPIIACTRSVLNHYKGQVYNKFESIPLATKGWHHSKARGDHIYIYPEELSQSKDTTGYSFEDFNFHTPLYKRLQDLGFTEPLEIQVKAIPRIINGQNTILAAETGCGKTLAYLLPMINQILEWKPLFARRYNNPLGLIITPTRELAVQIGMVAKKLGNNLGISTTIITGGRTKRIAMNIPMHDVDLIVASFGVMSKLNTMGIYNICNVRHIVLDEADALFHETFEDKLKVFMNRLPIGFQQSLDERGFPKSTQLTLASATMPQRIKEVLGHIVDVSSLIEVVTNKLHHILVPQKFIRLGPSQKPLELLKFIKPKVKCKEQVIIFSNENATCDWLSMFLHECNIDNVNLNGDMPLAIRQGKYANFKSGKINILSATNIGSRGLDTLTAQHILNYDFPLNTADYIHRCGRIGRIGSPKNCRVTNFISRPLEIQMVQKIERAIRKGKPIPIINIMEKELEEEPDLPIIEEEPLEPEHIIENIDEENSIPY